MFQPLYVAATGLSATEDMVLNITNDLANAKTIAYKKIRSEMEDLFYIHKEFKDILNDAMSAEEPTPVNVEYGTGVRIAATNHDFSQGTLETTSRPLDLAIEGDGFFRVKMADGTTYAYTRAGNFHADDQGNIVDPNGHILDTELTLPEGTTSLVIQQDGTVYYAINNETTYSELGQISLVRFPNKYGLKNIGQNLYQATDSSGEEIIGTAGEESFGKIRQYALEQSNVNVITSMMDLVIAQKVFDTITKAVQSYETMLGNLTAMKQA
ncbi:MAG: flagellar basal-body rod protein FlgG [Candidatus Margulisbacteria bacterium]|nr:flagellar basal-body rod protein FlgG [Candidatus Margulisiibacteriota bacterium]